MTTKPITSVVSLAGLLKSIFVSGRFKKDLPMQIVDPKGNAVCEIRTEDPERWIRTNYKDSIACTRKLCTRSQWDKMDIVQQVKLCDCWEALAVMEYLDVGYDVGNRFEIDEYEC